MLDGCTAAEIQLGSRPAGVVHRVRIVTCPGAGLETLARIQAGRPCTAAANFARMGAVVVGAQSISTAR